MRSMPISSRCFSGEARICRQSLIRSSAIFACVMRQSTICEPIRVTRMTAQRVANSPMARADEARGSRSVCMMSAISPTLAAPLAAPIRPARSTVFHDARKRTKSNFMAQDPVFAEWTFGSVPFCPFLHGMDFQVRHAFRDRRGGPSYIIVARPQIAIQAFGQSLNVRLTQHAEMIARHGLDAQFRKK